MQISTMILKSESLRDNLPGDPVEREVTIIEHNPDKSTPVLIGLAGFFGSGISFMNRSFTSMDFPSVLKKIVNENLVDSFIIVLPDTMTSYGGNQYINSPAVGNYEDFICKDLVSALKHRYGDRHMGLFGKSSGGFGSYTLGSRHPELFQGFIDVSGDSGFEYCYMRDFPEAIKTLQKTSVKQILNKFKQKEVLSMQELNTMNVIAMTAFYSPNVNSPDHIDLPFVVETGILLEEVWKRWKLLDPLENIRNHVDTLRKQKIILQVGTKDEFSLDIGIKALSSLMNQFDVPNNLLTYECGHFSIDYMYKDSIPELIKSLR